MPRLCGVARTRPPASLAVLRSLGHRQLRNPSWELPLHEHGVRAQCPTHRPLSSQRTLIRSPSSREDGSKSPGPEVHEAHPGPLANTCSHATLPQPTAPQHPRLPGEAHGGSSGSTPRSSAVLVHESCPGCSGRQAPGPLMSALRASEVPPQTSPGEKLRCREG